MEADSALLTGVNALDHGIAVWSEDGVLLDCNNAFCKRFNKPSSDALSGLNQMQFLHEIQRSSDLFLTVSSKEWLEQQAAAFAGRGKSRLMFSDGTIHQIEHKPIANGGCISIMSDFTEIIRNERALEKERDKSAASELVKSRFLRAANHDLRQPLASLKIFIYNCIGAQSDEEREQLLHNMDVSVSIMQDLLGALLNIGQLDAGQVEPKKSTFQVSTILERMRIQFEHLAQEKGLELRVMPSKVALNSDRALLERIISNLVANALRYTETGRVLVGCRRKGRNLRIQVTDTGPGIAPEHYDDIFKEFFRISSKQVYKKHSLGLGLNIAKRMADVLNHKLSVESTPGKGSTFSIDVPIGNVWHSDMGEPEINERVGGEFSGLTTLIMEDDEILREALASLLERWGMHVVVFDRYDDLQPSIAALENEPDLIISDYRLQGAIQGTDLVVEINDTLEKPCSAIVVTADTNPDLINGIRAQGFPVLIKPVSPPSLRVVMHNILYEPELVPEISGPAHAR
jgi:signal transduction histidine kinase/CheY-like chemotaxis protein